jgi:CheY-like chemotaxis protein
VRQILLNLLSNGVKYNTEKGKVFVEAGVLNDVMLRISVRDTGVGIPLEKQSNVFEAFNRLGAETSKVEGTGIGLVVSRELATLMNGNLGFTSSLGEGSTFWLDLPLSIDEDDRQIGDNGVAREKTRITEEAPLSAAESRLCVLYVEDNPANQRLMTRVLSRLEKVDLVLAGTAELGLELAEWDPPDIIFLDVNLPGINGLEAMKQLRSNPVIAGLPVIAVSANAMPEDIDRALAAGFDDYVTKPFDLLEIEKRIRQASGSKA